MQKLKGTSSGQNNKSCRIIHHESNKISLAFFRFFCDFLRNLKDSANLFNYWSYLFAIKTLERLLSLQCGPWGGRLERAAQFRRGRRGPWPGKGRGRVLGGLGAGFRARLGWGGGQQGRRRRPGLVAAAACLAGEVGRCGG
jgi:hypothetical protein